MSKKVLEFLRRRRSVPPALLGAPAPSRDELHGLLEMAARVPDHGKLEPWRFLILGPETKARIAPLVAERVRADGRGEEKAAKAGAAFRSPMIVAVVFSPKDSDKVPEWEQFLSAGAVCVSLVNAALAAGYGASWLTGMATDEDFARAHLGLGADERIAGLIHIGSSDAAPPDRPRPDIDAITDWMP